MTKKLQPLKWKHHIANEQHGVVLASDEKQEWMLPWWWENYSKYNCFPVTFVDFGLSDVMKTWCEVHGERVELPALDYLASKSHTDENKSEIWEKIYEGRSWWHKRVMWHQKPIAMLQTPYEYTLWVDTDCEIASPLDALFADLQKSPYLWIAQETEEMQQFDRDKQQLLQGEILYNSGVIGFQKGSPQILEWAEETVSEHRFHWSDQNLLSRLIYENKWPVQELSPLYNWRPVTYGANPEAKIIHWVGEIGKFFISLKVQKVL